MPLSVRNIQKILTDVDKALPEVMTMAQLSLVITVVVEHFDAEDSWVDISNYVQNMIAQKECLGDLPKPFQLNLEDFLSGAVTKMSDEDHILDKDAIKDAVEFMKKFQSN